jgi:two-component system cell cycle response regulator DivK
MSKRILVVEDQPDNRQIIRDMLAPTGYEITEAALVAIAKRRPDLILMDIQLPIVDGYTATSQIKADPALRLIPIIAVTSYALSGEERKARAAGFLGRPRRREGIQYLDSATSPGSFAIFAAAAVRRVQAASRLPRSPRWSQFLGCTQGAVSSSFGRTDYLNVPC